jgi:5-methylcytosine-specific restriction endonuclease McrA
MGRKDEKKWRSRPEPVREFWELPVANSVQEKDKARDLRHTSWWRQKISSGVCFYCGKKVLPSELTMDHIIPLSRGGRSERSNIAASCKDCNNRKKYLLPSEWEDYVETIKNDGSAGAAPSEAGRGEDGHGG